MNEQELRDRLREEMAASSQPPPMDFAPTLTRARGTHRRRAALTGGGAAMGVVALAFGAAAALGSAPAPNSPALQVDTAASAVQPAPPQNPERLLKQLRAALPATVIVQDGPVTKAETFPYKGGNGVMATAAVSLAGGDPTKTGRVQVRVYPPGEKLSTCQVISDFAGKLDLKDCENHTPVGGPTGIVTMYEPHQRISSVVGFGKQPTGSIVVVSQSTHAQDNGTGLAEPPLTSQQQRALVTDARLTAN